MNSIFTLESFQSQDRQTIRYAVLNATEGESEGHPVIFVPGLGGTVKAAIDFLAHFLPRHGPIYSMDARGLGINEALPFRMTPGGYLKDFHQFMNYLSSAGLIRPDKPPYLMGISLGGVYATLYAGDCPDRFKGLILLAPAFSPHPTVFDWRYRLKAYSSLLIKGHKAMVTLPYGVRELTKNTAVYDDPLYQNPMVMPSFYLYLIQRLCSKAKHRVNRLQLPAAMVIPEKDIICDPECMKQAFRRINTPYKACFTYPDLYHDVAQETLADQALVTSDLLTWMESISVKTE